jgi:hypothetical protein
LENELEYVDQDWILGQFNHLRFRISFKARESHSLSDLETLNDMDWVKRKIEDLSGGIVLDRIDYGTANRLWKQYNTGIPKGDEWEYIDACLKDHRKIDAIKTYRQLHKCGLREAKDAIDDRMMANINNNLKGII